MFPGFPTRLRKDILTQFQKEIDNHTRDRTQKYKVNVMDPPTRKNAVFCGASVCANVMGGNPEFWITKEQYDDAGTRELIHNDGL